MVFRNYSKIIKSNANDAKKFQIFFGKFLMNNFILWLVTHYESFFRVSCYHIIPEYLPWLQNDVKMQKPQNQIFHNQEKQ